MTARQGIAALAAVLLTVAALPARTIVVSDEECDRMAAISADAPRLSWATYLAGTGIYSTQYTIDLRKGKAFLIHYPIDKIPKGQRITKAELVVPVHQVEGEQKLVVRRLVADWGAGVCHDYRMIRPKKVEWAKPGARDNGLDAKPTTSVRVSQPGEQILNVTEDVELWYTKAATNHGWIFTTEYDSPSIQLVSPISDYPPGRGKWKLRITYEPAD
jgi:hypothetical protein